MEVKIWPRLDEGEMCNTDELFLLILELEDDASLDTLQYNCVYPNIWKVLATVPMQILPLLQLLPALTVLRSW